MKKILLCSVIILALFNVKAQTGLQPYTVAGGNGFGNDGKHLDYPWSVFVDGAGNIYVSDGGNNRVQKFPANSNSQTYGTTVAGGNGFGSNSNQLNAPNGIFLDGNGNLYVADGINNRVQKFPVGSDSSTAGLTVAGGNGAGSASNQLSGPNGIFVDASGNLYVADETNQRIQKFPAGSSSSTSGVTVAGGNGEGPAANQLSYPADVYLDGNNNIYVADGSNNRIQKFPAGSNSTTNGVTVAGGNGPGSGPNQFLGANGIFVDNSGNFYVADNGNERIQKFPPGSSSSTNGVTVAGGNGAGTGSDQLNTPVDVFVDGSNNIYIVEMENNRVQKWGQATAVLNVPGEEGVKLYPNPNNGSFTLRFNNNMGKECIIYDMTGRTLLSQYITTGTYSMEMKDISNGPYMLEIKGTDGNERIKFIVERQ